MILNSSTNFDKISKQIFHYIAGTFGASKGAIYTYNATSNIFSLQIQRNFNFESSFTLNQKLISYISKTSAVKTIDLIIDEITDSVFLTNIKEQKGSILAPIIFSSKLLGFIILGKKLTKKKYSNLDFQLLQIICNNLSSSLNNSNLLFSIKNQKNKLNKTLFELETFFDTSKILHNISESDAIYENILYRAISLMNVEGGIMFTLQNQSPICILSAILHHNEDKVKNELFTKNFKYFNECLKTNSSIIINNVEHKKLLTIGWNNVIICPLRGSQSIYGFLILGQKETINGVMPFNEEDIELGNVISMQSGLALENKLLINDLEKEKKSVRNIIRSIGNGIITLNMLGEVETYNDQAKNILEKNDLELKNHHYLFLFDDNPKIIDSITKCIDRGSSVIEPNMSLKINSKNKNINFTSRPLIDDKGNYIGVILGIENITDELRLKNTFKRYVSENIVDQIIDDKLDLGMGGKLKDVTILFSDIRGFTEISEKIKPDEVVSLLNEYYTKMIEIIFKYNGTLDKIVGDELMVVFGAPLKIKNAPNAALETAIEMQKQLIEFNKKSMISIKIGIGINSGKVISGNIGSEVRSDYTVIGGNVNLASRLCSNAKSNEILVSKQTYDLINKKKSLKKMVSFKAKGIEKEIENWRVEY